MTVTTQRDRFLHLLPREILLEPFVAMASPRNQMMFRRPFLGNATAKRTLLKLFGHRCDLRTFIRSVGILGLFMTRLVRQVEE